MGGADSSRRGAGGSGGFGSGVGHFTTHFPQQYGLSTGLGHHLVHSLEQSVGSERLLDDDGTEATKAPIKRASKIRPFIMISSYTHHTPVKKRVNLDMLFKYMIQSRHVVLQLNHHPNHKGGNRENYEGRDRQDCGTR